MLSRDHSRRIAQGAFQGTVVLVTGGGGFIGSHLAERLCRLGATVRVLDDFSTGQRSNLLGLDIELFDHSILDEAALAAAINGCELVLHHAAFVSVPGSVLDPETCRSINIDGTARVLEAARASGVRRLINASSSAVYGNQDALSFAESRPLEGDSPYALSKQESESLVRSGAGDTLDTVSLRYFNIFGPRQRSDTEYSAVIAAFASALCTGRPVELYGDGSQTRDFLPVAQLVDAVLATCIHKDPLRGEAINIGSGHARSVQDVLLAIARLLQVEPVIRQFEARPGDVSHSCSDMTRTRNLLHFLDEDLFESGLSTLVEWMRQSLPC